MEKYTEDKLNDLFSRRLKAIMDENGVNQVELSYAMGLERSTVNKWLMKKALPRMGVVEKLAAYFMVEKSYFMDEKADLNTRIYYLSREEQDIIKKYRQLGADDKEKVHDFIDYRLYKAASSSEQEEENLG